MWSMFVLAVLVGALFLYLPGFLVLRGCRMSLLASFVFAPLLSLAVYALLCILYAKIGVSAAWMTLLIPFLLSAALVCGIGFAVRRRKTVLTVGFPVSGRERRESKCWWSLDAVQLTLYVVAGLTISSLAFGFFLSSPDSFVQEFDNIHHLGQIRTFVESGNWSALTSSLYAAGPDAQVNPLPGSGFYPTAWHTLAALLVSALGVTVPLAANAVNFLFVGVVFPVSMFALMRFVFCKRPGIVAFGSLTTLAFSAFPWMLLLFGPLYPNAMAFCLLPLIAVVFMALFVRGACRSERIAAALLFVTGVLCGAFTQPNVIFSAGVFLIPFCVYQAAQAARLFRLEGRSLRFVQVGLGVVTCAVLALVWLILYKLPFLQDLVSHSWPAVLSKSDAVLSVLLLNFRAAGAQIVLAVLVVVGGCCTLKYREYLWLSVAYVLAAFLYAVSVSSDGPLQHLLAGFWYTDSFRMAAMAALFAVPLASVGLWTVAKGLAAVLSKVLHWEKACAAVIASVCIVSVAFLLGNYFPGLTLPVQGAQSTALASVWQSLKMANDVQGPAVYDLEEQAFVEEVERLLPEDALLLNEPNDGSAFAYGVDGLRVYYRNLRTYGIDAETSESRLIRTRLKEIASDDQVKNAVDKIGAKYLIVLDQGAPPPLRKYLFTYEGGSSWAGIESVRDDTPGFEVVLSHDDMRLYKITVVT